MYNVGEEVIVKINGNDYEGVIIKQLASNKSNRYVLQLWDENELATSCYRGYPMIITTEDKMFKHDSGYVASMDHLHEFDVDDVVKYNDEVGYIVSSCGYHNTKEGYLVEVLNTGAPKRVIWGCREMKKLSDEELNTYFSKIIADRSWYVEEDDEEEEITIYY